MGKSDSSGVLIVNHPNPCDISSFTFMPGTGTLTKRVLPFRGIPILLKIQNGGSPPRKCIPQKKGPTLSS